MAMVGRYRGFISYLKQNVSGVLEIHCVIHRQHLVAKNLSVRLHEALHLVIDAVNRIHILLHTEVHWLSRGLCLTRFFCTF